MGTDIHSVFQKRVNDQWLDIPSKFEDNRHYELFGWLANVRNGVGFAGIRMGEPMTPIAYPRGLPEDFLVLADNPEYHPTSIDKVNEHMAKWWATLKATGNPAFEDDRDKIWMGYHDHSWLTFHEILNTKVPSSFREGVLSIAEFKKWDGVSEPESYCGDVWGKNIVMAHHLNQIRPETTHVKVRWEMPSDTFDYFLDELKRLMTVHTDAVHFRVVFGFDS